MRLRHLVPLFLIVAASGCRLNEEITAPVVLDTGESADSKSKGRDRDRVGSGAVYVMSNAISGNEVIAFRRGADGILGAATHHPTGGTGTGAGLGNQGGVVLTANGRWLFAVNAGSNEISSFQVMVHGLRLRDKTASGGVRPVSLTVHENLLFVLNAGGDGNVTGFRIRSSGRLAPIRKATRPLSHTAADAAQIAFTPDGKHLVVTERATNTISVYSVDDEDGSIRGPRAHASSGATPFGFGFGQRGTLIVSEAFGGAPGASAASSYRLGHRGGLQVVSASVPTMQSSACWLAVSGDARFAYTANTGSGTVTGFRIGAGGSLTRLNADGVTGTAGTGPADLAFGAGRYLYVRNGGSSSISAFRMRRDGSLESISGSTALPAGANGLAAR